MKAAGLERRVNATDGMSASALPACPKLDLRSTLELGVAAMLVAIALHTWVVLGLVVPVTVSGGSMAETLVGPHRQIVCSACGTAFRMGLDQLPASGRAVCPHCQCRDNNVHAAGDRPGQHLWVDRTVLWRGGGLRRWQVVVFRCPEEASRLGVKRVVGLPGESVHIRQGDVFIDGRIARKDLRQQRATAQFVHRVGPDRRHGGSRRWRPGAVETWWRCKNGVFYRRYRAGGVRPGAADWLCYHHPARQPVRDDVGYNQGLSRTLNGVTDLMLTCLAEMSGPGQLLLAADAGCHRFEVQIPNQGGDLCLYSRGRDVARAPIGPGMAGTSRRVELSLFDAQLLLAIDGAVHLRYTYDQPSEKTLPSSKPLAIGARGLDVVLRDLTVWRDIYYTHPRWGQWGLDRAWRLGHDETFVLGDNSPISADSRSWHSGAGLPLRFLVGTPIGIE